MPAYRSYPRNTEGTDWIVSDIHGAYDLVDQGLSIIDFRQGRDRLFSVGDLMDRGEYSTRVLEFPWIHAVRGNHDEMYIKSVDDNGKLNRFYEDEFDLKAYGSQWMKYEKPETLLAIREQLKTLPYAIEIDTVEGPAGIVHAEIPSGWSWQKFIDALQAKDALADLAVRWATESRMRIYGQLEKETPGNPGISRIFCGHTPQEQGIKKRGNVFYIDTGIARRLSLTFVNAAAPDDQIVGFPNKGGYSVDVRGLDSPRIS